MERSSMTGYAAIVIGIAIIMFSIVATSIGAALAVARFYALLSFGGFIASFGFLTAGIFSREPDAVRGGMIVASAILILATIRLI